VTSYTNNVDVSNTLRASGAGSLLSLPNVETITGRSSLSRNLSIQALGGGHVELGAVTEVVSGAVHFRANGQDSIIDLPRLNSFQGYFWQTQSGFEATDSGTIACGSLTSLRTADITLDATGVMDTAQIVSYTGGGTLNASVIARDFGELTTLNGITLNAVGVVPQLGKLTNIDGSSLLVSDGAELVLPQVTSYTNNVDVSNTLRASGAGSLLSLPNVETITGRSSLSRNLSIQALGGGHVELGAVTEVVSGAVHFRANGQDSIIDLLRLNSFQGYFWQTQSGFEATDSGTIACGSLTSLRTADITLDATGVMDTAQIVSYTGGGTLNASVMARDLGEMTTLNGITLNAVAVVPQLGKLTNIDGSSLLVSDGAELVLPQVTSYTNNVDASNTLRASGAGSLLSLPNVETITGRSSLSRNLSIQALGGGRVELGAVTQVVSGAVHFKAHGENSIIELPWLSSFQGYFWNTQSGFEAANGGTIQVGTLVAETSVRTANIDVASTGNLITNRFVLGSAATLRGTGTFSGSVTNGGTVQPGSGIGTLIVDVDFAQLPSGVLQIEVGGSTTPAQSDLLQVSGTATLDGTVQVVRVGTALPSIGQELVVLQADEMLGAFSAFNGLALGGGVKLQPVYGNEDVRFVGIVDAGPRIVGATPGGTIDSSLRSFQVTFDEPINAASFTAEDIVLVGPQGVVTVNNPTLVSGNTFQFTVDTQVAPGVYSLTIGPNVTDTAGNPMDQNGNAVNGEPEDVFTHQVTVSDVQQAVLFVNVPGSYNADAGNFYQNLLAAGARAKRVDLASEGLVAAALAADDFDQVWVFDLATGSNDFPADWTAISTWYADNATDGDHLRCADSGLAAQRPVAERRVAADGELLPESAGGRRGLVLGHGRRCVSIGDQQHQRSDRDRSVLGTGFPEHDPGRSGSPVDELAARLGDLAVQRYRSRLGALRRAARRARVVCGGFVQLPGAPAGYHDHDPGRRGRDAAAGAGVHAAGASELGGGSVVGQVQRGDRSGDV
jgi:hypothetical protein